MSTSGMKPRIVFFGNERLATGVTTSCPILTMLIAEGYDVVAVVANDSGTVSRNSHKLEIETVANEHRIPFYKPSQLPDITGILAALDAPVAVLAAYGKMVPKIIIDLFPVGIINIHPSLLPKHRGSTPIESVILDGSTDTAVSLMQLVPAMDAGSVYAQTPVKLVGNESKQDLADRLGEIGTTMLKELLPDIIAGTVIALPQDHTAATYDQRIDKNSGILDLAKPAAQLEREVRAYAEWPKSHIPIAGRDVVITAAHVTDNSLENVDKKTIFISNKQLCVQTVDGVLVIDNLKPAGKSDMPAAAFLAGYGKNL